MSSDTIPLESENVLVSGYINAKSESSPTQEKDALNIQNFKTSHVSIAEKLDRSMPSTKENNIGMNMPFAELSLSSMHDDVSSNLKGIRQSKKSSEEKSEMENGFVFNPQSRMVRFTWGINAQGYLHQISEDLSKTVGPYALKIAGIRFCDINDILNLDPNNHISELIKQCDTWSGKTTYWPIEGTDLHVPVDLAALPIYTRDREFNGFKGFGIIRVGEVSSDPLKLGMILDAKFSAFYERKDNGSFVERPAQENFTDIEKSNKYFTETFWARKNFLCEEDHTSPLNTTDSYHLWDQQGPENQTPSFPDQLNIKNKTSLLFEQNMTDGDTIKSAEKDLILKGKNDLLSQNEDFHSINLNQYAKDISPERKTSVLKKGKTEHYGDSLHCNNSLFPYFYKGKDLNPESLDKHPTAFLLMHSNGSLLYANPAFFFLTGYKNIKKIEEIGGLSTLLDSQKLSNDERPLGAVTLYRSDRTNISVSAHLHSIRWEKENALAITFIPFKNEAKRFEEMPTLEKSSKKERNPHKLEIEVMQLCSILEISTDGIAILKGDGKVLSTNRSFNRLFGHNEKDILGKYFTIFFIDEHQEIMSDCFTKLASLNIEDPIKKMVVGCTAQGNTISLHITIKKLPFSDCYCLIVRNVSQWEKAEKENAHKSDFLARVSHEIRTPLNAIIGFAEVIKDQRFGPVGNPRYREYASYINRSGNHVLDIVNDLLDISKIEAGEMDVHFEPISLNETIFEAISLIKLYANEKRVLVRTSFSNKIPQIFADLRSIKQIALNILSNAIHFTPSGGQIVISTAYKNNKGVILRIRDTGIGMTRCELEKAMKPFGQVPHPEKEHGGGGTGLGLPLTKAMVDANMGSFSISSAPEKGTLVEIIFPTQQAI